MIRALWRALVPGAAWAVWWWVLWTAIQVYRESPILALINGLMFVLNLYSWDYQRRHRAVSPDS